jgi:hypothetical protein
MSLGTSATGLVRAPLLTVEEVDKALQVKMRYRAPGSGIGRTEREAQGV